MYLCYIDEAGCTGRLPSQRSDIQPTFTLVGVIVPYGYLDSLTHAWIHLKERFFRESLSAQQRKTGRSHYLEGILYEIKGNEIRKDIAGSSRNKRRHRIGFLDATVKLLRNHRVQFFARSLIKGVGVDIRGQSLYTSFAQDLCKDFQSFLATFSDEGLVIADSRDPNNNTSVAHSIFTSKYRAAGDLYPNLAEMPTFGHSDNHAGLQIADLLASAMITPALIAHYCSPHINGTHIRPKYHHIRTRYTNPLRELQYRYQDADGYWRGGLHVKDRLDGLRTGSLFAASDIV